MYGRNYIFRITRSIYLCIPSIIMQMVAPLQIENNYMELNLQMT